MNFAMISTFVMCGAWIAAALAARASADLRNRIWRAALVVLVLAILPIPLPEGVRISVTTQVSAAVGGLSETSGVPSLIFLWAAGAALMLARSVAGWIGLRRLMAGARRSEDGVYLSDAIATPLTWGVLNPIILLPSDAPDWPREEYERAMRHERAHIQRRDWAWQVFGQVVLAAFWFHPLVWLAAAEMRREAELAADDAVLRDGADAQAYAAQLVSTARRASLAPPLGAVAMIRARALESRVAAILSTSKVRTPAPIRSRLALIAAAALLLVPMTVLDAAKTYHIGEQGVTSPTVVTKVDPEYTEEARSAKIQGTTTLTMVINEKGFAEKIKVRKPLDKGLDAKAIDSVKQWRFKPAMLHGKPVRVAATIEVNFRLK